MRPIDMIGNAREWRSDWYDKDDYSKSPEPDPAGPNWGAYRVAQGGIWDPDAVRCCAAFRGWCLPGLRRDYLGFRVARSSGE